MLADSFVSFFISISVLAVVLCSVLVLFLAVFFCFVFFSIAVLAAMLCFGVGCYWPCCFVLLFAFFDSVLTLEAQLLLQTNLSAIVMALFRSYERDSIGFFARCMGFLCASALILFLDSWRVCPISGSALLCEESDRLLVQSLEQ